MREKERCFCSYESRIHCCTLALRVGEKATREVWGLTFVAAGGLTIMHHLHIPDYLPTEREVQLNSIHRAKRQWTQTFNIWLWVELTLLCDGRVKTVQIYKYASIKMSRKNDINSAYNSEYETILNELYIHVTVHRNRFLFNNQPDALIIQIYSVIKFYVFRASSLPFIRIFLLYVRHW